jgi:hypothetical protein
MLKNEEALLEQVLPIWATYPVNTFVFYDDNSTDSSIDVISKYLPKERYVILNDKLESFNESYNRSKMLEYSRENNSDYVFTIDCDELLSANFDGIFEEILKNYEHHNFLLYWYNVVNNTLNLHRQDPAYLNNYRTFILPMKHTGKFDTSQARYHVPRTPSVNMPHAYTKEIGVIHLQSINTKFYAIKQLWYKHFEFVNYGYSEVEINNKYDSVVNGLNFNPTETPQEIVGDIKIDPSIFDTLLVKKGYLDFIKKHFNEKLVTFGKEYIDD